MSAGNTVLIQSGGDTNLKGAVIAANTVKGTIGGNLNIESLQDTSTFASQQKNAGVGVSLCIPPLCYGSSSVSGSVGKANATGNYASVIEQSGIKAGDGGFQISVKGNTDLKGGVISSTDKAIAEGKNSLVTATLTTSDIQNRDDYKASGYSLGVTLSGKIGDQNPANLQGKDKTAAQTPSTPGGSAGIGSASGSQGSTTRSGISGGAITITDGAKQQDSTGNSAAEALAAINGTVTTGQDTAGAITKAWNGNQLMTDVQAQTQITAAFGAAGAKQVAEYSATKEKEALLNNDPIEAAKWAEGGVYRAGLHAGVALLAGGVPGAAGAITSAALMPTIGNAIDGMDLPGPVKQALGAVAAGALGAAVGGAAGASTAFNVDINNRQLHPTETKRIKELAAGDAEKERRLTAAACALVHCADGVPKDDPNYALLKGMQTAGEAMTAEQTLLSQQTGWQGRTSGSLFQYTGVDQYLIDPVTQNSIGTRAAGAVQAGAGIVGVATSGALCTTGLGCLAAGVTGTISADYAAAGMGQVVTGKATVPFGEQVLQSLGMSPGAAALTYAAVGIVPVVGGTSLVKTATGVKAEVGTVEQVAGGVKGGTGGATTVTGPVTHRPVPDLLAEANAPINESGISQATRAWDKHSGRPGGTFEPLSGTTTEKNVAVSSWISGAE